MSFYAESVALDFMKLAGFYVDLNDRLEVISRGGDITASDAARHIRDSSDPAYRSSKPVLRTLPLPLRPWGFSERFRQDTGLIEGVECWTGACAI
jgi:hypothetical protein